MALTPDQIRAAAAAAGFTGNDLNVAVAVAQAESSGNNTATHLNNNGSTDYGLFQINSIHPDLLATGNWTDPNANAKMAYAVFKASGWKAWSTFNSGSYERYMTGPSSVTATGAVGAAAAGTAAASTTTSGILGLVPGLEPLIELVTKILTAFEFMMLPTTWIRIMCGIGGSILLFMGVAALIHDVRE